MTMDEVILIGGMALVTFGIRYSMFAVAGRITFPTWLENSLRYVPPAVLTAIILPAVLIPPSGDVIVVSYTNPYLVAALFAFGVGWFSKNLLLTIVLGMMGFWGWQWVLAGGADIRTFLLP